MVLTGGLGGTTGKGVVGGDEYLADLYKAGAKPLLRRRQLPPVHVPAAAVGRQRARAAGAGCSTPAQIMVANGDARQEDLGHRVRSADRRSRIGLPAATGRDHVRRLPAVGRRTRGPVRCVGSTIVTRAPTRATTAISSGSTPRTDSPSSSLQQYEIARAIRQLSRPGSAPHSREGRMLDVVSYPTRDHVSRSRRTRNRCVDRARRGAGWRRVADAAAVKPAATLPTPSGSTASAAAPAFGAIPPNLRQGQSESNNARRSSASDSTTRSVGVGPRRRHQRRPLRHAVDLPHPRPVIVERHRGQQLPAALRPAGQPTRTVAAPRRDRRVHDRHHRRAGAVGHAHGRAVGHAAAQPEHRVPARDVGSRARRERQRRLRPHRQPSHRFDLLQDVERGRRGPRDHEGRRRATATALNGYRMLAADGGVFDFGGQQFYGSTGGRVLNQPIVAGVNTCGNARLLVRRQRRRRVQLRRRDLPRLARRHARRRAPVVGDGRDADG